MTYIPHTTIFVALVSVIYYLQPSVLEPVIWTDPFPLPTLSGSTAPNKLLEKSQKVGVGQTTGAESIAIDVENGTVYASLSDGRVVHLSPEGEFLSTLFFSGGFIASDAKTRKNGVDASTSEKMKWCTEEAHAHRLAWNPSGERSCGRPLGIRYSPADRMTGDASLYFVDAYYGLFSNNLRTKTAKHLYNSATNTDSLPSAPEGSDPLNKLPLTFLNDLEVSADRSEVFITDTSYKHVRAHNREELLDGAPRGRLLRYDAKAKTMTVLLCGLHFANGVQFKNPSDPSHSTLLVVESTRFRILEVDVRALIKDKEGKRTELLQSCEERGSLWKELARQKQKATPTDKDGSSGSKPAAAAPSSVVSVFLDEVPGFLDNIRVDSKSLSSRYPEKVQFFGGVGTKSTKPFSLLWTCYQGTLLRDIVGKFLPMRYVEKIVPKYGFVLRFDAKGKIVGSLQDPSGSIAFISEAHRHPKTGDIWIGSHSNPFIGILKAKDIPNV